MSMRRNRRSTTAAVTTGILLAGLLAMGLAQAADEAGRPARGSQLADSETLGGEQRYLAHVSTDKPIYRTGDEVYVRSVLLHATTRVPLADDTAPPAVISIHGPKGDTVATGHADTEHSVTGFAWTVPDGQPGGAYTVRVSYPTLGTPPAERAFDIRAYRAPRLRTQIVYLRDGYGPGDTVQATADITRAEGGIPAGATVEVIARVDGQVVHRGQTNVDEQGHATARFDLPEQIERGEGTLAFVVEDGGVVETASKTLPILLQTLDIAIYPEGGDLVAGLPNRVYVEARQPNGKPADIEAQLVDAASGEPVNEIVPSNRRMIPGPVVLTTEHEGRGIFEFAPTAGGRYALEIINPTGIEKRFELPAVREDGAVLRAHSRTYQAGQPVRLAVATQPEREVRVTLSRREQVVAEITTADAGPTFWFGHKPVTLTPPADADGILIATVWDADGNPLAERLIYREPAERVNIAIETTQTEYVPGEAVELTVRTTGESGDPVPATVGLTVTDDSVLEMIEKREQAPRLPVMVLLEPEVRELADAHVYLDAENEQATLALDLLLGTQGWRRFAHVDPETFLAEHGDTGQRALAMRAVTDEGLRTLAEAQPEIFWRVVNENGQLRGRVEELGLDRRREVRMMQLRAGADEWEEAAARDALVDEVAAAGEGGEMRPDAPVEAAAGPADEAADERALAPVAEAAQAAPQLAEQQRLVEMRDADGLIAADMAQAPQRPRARQDFVIVREYAHAARADRQRGERRDFTETLYWHAGVRTDDSTGEATVRFDLSDAVTSFRVFADGFDARGALGSGDTVIESVEPFYLEPKLPLEVTQGDVIELPVSLVNNTRGELQVTPIRTEVPRGVAVFDAMQHPAVDAPAFYVLEPRARERAMLRLTVDDFVGEGQVTLGTGGLRPREAGRVTDQVTRPLRVVPRGFPAEIAEGGMLEPGQALRFEVNIPETRIAGSLTSEITVYPSPMANMTQALERMIREPYGCFEQTSSTTYPLVMAQQYFVSHHGVDPALIERSQAMLDKGYDRLVSFEVAQTHGYEWFGANPAHEALTAYGLLEFTDMAEVREVDREMIQRTRRWLLDRRDGEGGFKRNAQALDSFGGAPDAITNAYITWALLEAGETGLEPEIDRVAEYAREQDDPYLLALAANIMHLADRADEAGAIQARLAEAQAEDGRIADAETSITRSSGQSLDIETTSLAVLAGLRDPAAAAEVERAMRWLVEQCEAGRFGSTQSTVLALRAIIAYDAARAAPRAAGALTVRVDGQPVGTPVRFDADTHGALTLDDITGRLEPGRHVIEVSMADGSPMPASVAIGYHDERPNSSPDSVVALTVSLADDKLDEGAVTEANVTVTNRGDDMAPMPVAIIGVPGGLEVRHDQLKELVEAGRIAAYEVNGREVVLYWRALTPGQRVELPVSMVAAVPGTYTGPASRAYLYYGDEHKQWAEPLTVTITAR